MDYDFDIVFTPDPSLIIEEKTLVEVSYKGGLNVRTAPSMSASKVKVLPFKTKVELLSEENGWGKIDENQFINLDFVNYL